MEPAPAKNPQKYLLVTSKMNPASHGPIVPPTVAPNRIKPKMEPMAKKPKYRLVISGIKEANPPYENPKVKLNSHSIHTLLLIESHTIVSI